MEYVYGGSAAAVVIIILISVLVYIYFQRTKMWVILRYFVMKSFPYILILLYFNIFHFSILFYLHSSVKYFFPHRNSIAIHPSLPLSNLKRNTSEKLSPNRHAPCELVPSWGRFGNPSLPVRDDVFDEINLKNWLSYWRINSPVQKIYWLIKIIN